MSSFTEAAKEVVYWTADWVATYPINAAIWVGITALGVTLAKMRYNGYRANRLKVKELLGNPPDVKRIRPTESPKAN